MKAVLVSPHFLFRVEDDPKNPERRPHASTTTNSPPGCQLLPLVEHAGRGAVPARREGRTAQAGVLEAQVKRMLKDPKARRWPRTSPGSGCNCGTCKPLTPDKGYFPDWDDALRDGDDPRGRAVLRARRRRTTAACWSSSTPTTPSSTSRLAKHYGIPDVNGAEFRKVKLPDGRRGGVLTQASMLTVTSNPTRTSPVKRGKWILENILGTPPPPPAPDVPELPPTGQLKGTLRQQMEQHRANPNCAVCHAKLDPLGFGLENFDAIGGVADAGQQAADRRRPACCRTARSSTARRNCGRCCSARPTCSAGVSRKNCLPSPSAAG